MNNRNTRLRHSALGGFAALLLIAGWASGAAAADPDPPFRMGLPIHCDPGKTCWIVNYVDHDPTEGVRDYMCGDATYNMASSSGNAHKGTDFAIRDLAAMWAGVPVLAAAGGRVAGTRDGMADHAITSQADVAALGGKDCGNGVGIDHGGGWFTQYCHMRRGSILVKRGQDVSKGQPLGLVGLSGFTQFPHVHIQVMQRKKAVDPFTGVAGGPACGPGKAPLWDAKTMAELPYVLGQIYNVGFAGEKPSPGKVRNGDYDGAALDRHAPALVLWAELFNVRVGDRIALSIRLPDGRVLVDHTTPIAKDQARYYLYAGRPLKARAWPTGTYTGEVRIKRADGTTSARNLAITLR